MEALRLGIDKTPAYLDRINAFEESLVFDAFVQKVIVPDNKMREEEVKAYYDTHLPEHSYPGMLRIRSLAFTKRATAEAAIEKLRAGTDFGWLAVNAEDQVEKGTRRTRWRSTGGPSRSTACPTACEKAARRKPRRAT